MHEEKTKQCSCCKKKKTLDQTHKQVKHEINDHINRPLRNNLWHVGDQAWYYVAIQMPARSTIGHQVIDSVRTQFFQTIRHTNKKSK